MSLYSIYFSPTGGTKKVTELLLEGWQETPNTIDLSDAGYNFEMTPLNSQDVCLIAAPSFGGRVPETALARLSELKAGGAIAVLVTSYGNRAYDDTLLELQDAAEACGFRIAAAVAAVTEHSILRQFGQGRPDAADEAQLRGFSGQIREAVKALSAGNGPHSARRAAVLTLPGSRPFRDYRGVPFKPKAGKECTGCGICTDLCPVGAIPANNPRETNPDLCISCMRCIFVCPAHARSLNKAMLIAAAGTMKKAFAGRKPNELFLAQTKRSS